MGSEGLNSGIEKKRKRLVTIVGIHGNNDVETNQKKRSEMFPRFAVIVVTRFEML
jgi:hypothetical protein